MSNACNPRTENVMYFEIQMLFLIFILKLIVKEDLEYAIHTVEISNFKW